MPSRASLTLAELVEMTLPEPVAPEGDGGGEETQERTEAQMADERGPQAANAAARGAGPEEDLRDVPAELSHLLAELARTPDAGLDVDVAAGWTPDLKPGDVVAGRFELRRELGRGGFGVVFEALDRDLGREVAFKVVLPGRRVSVRNQEWVQREAEAVACLNHPNIVTLHDFGRAPTGPYLIFELLRGETLGQRLKRGPLPLRGAVALAATVARVLDHAHRAGVVHRDLKPGNVFLCQHGAVKVLDFGLAHLFGRGGVLCGGTPAYMSPEQKRSEPGDARSDVFALGVVLHEMITGAVPARPDKEPEGPLVPGAVAQLPKDAAPARLRRLVARMLDRDPAQRPASAREVLDELEVVERRLDGGRWRAGATWAGVLLAVALGIVAVVEPFRPPQRFVVAVADFENDTGEREFGGLSGLLATSLQQSRQIRLVPRWKLVSLLGRIGAPPDSPIEGDLARRLAREAGAKVLLVGSTHRVGDRYALELQALDPTEQKDMFSLAEVAPAKAALLGALDRLAEGVRRKLDDASADIRAARHIPETVTPDIDAYQAYWAGVDCIDRPSLGGGWVSHGRCALHFREALARDPGFSLAHYQLALLLQTNGRPRAEVEGHLQAALRGIDRMPRREAALVRAWNAYVAGRTADALAAYDAILEETRDDRDALYLAGYVQFWSRRWADAVPYLQRVLDVDPEAEWPLDDLVTALAMLRRADDLRTLEAHLGAEATTPARTHAMMRIRIWLGDPAAAVALARAAVDRGGGPAAELDLAGALFVAGELAEAEAVLEALRAAQPTDGATAYALARVLGAQGRIRDGLDVIDRYGRAAEQEDQPVVQYARAMFLGGTADPHVLWREAAKTRALSAADAGLIAVVLALRGDLAHADELARDLPRDGVAFAAYDALSTWRRGDAAAAAARLTALEGSDPWPPGVPPPSYLLAEVSAADGDWRATAAAVERYRALWPRGLTPGWTLPRASFLAALAHARLGERDLARAELDRLAGWLRAADPDLALARDARTLRQAISK